MYVHLDDDLTLQLRCEHPLAEKKWRFIFDGRIASAPMLGALPALTLTFRIQPQLPALPSRPPYFVDTRPGFADAYGSVEAYAGDGDECLLHFLRGALVQISTAEAHLSASGVLTEQMLRSERVEDVTLTSLAPLLRRRGYYLMHAFAAERDGEAILIVGASKSGKTTTGLNLVLNGWNLLSNDAVLLQQREDGVYALPTPGCVTIRPPTFKLLPALRRFSAEAPTRDIALTAAQVAGGRWATSTPVRRIYFSHIDAERPCATYPLMRAIGLAQLMEESVDRWDRDTLDAHMGVLQQLTEQAYTYTLQLGRNISVLPELLRRA